MEKSFINLGCLGASEDEFARRILDGVQTYTNAVLDAINPVPKHDLPIAIAALTGVLEMLINHADDDETEIASQIYSLLDSEDHITVKRRKVKIDE